jgi:ABC-type protease/lipase transport system fused ATPase/permease subunit
MIAGTATPSAGKVRLDGADIAVWLDADGARYLGYLPQDVELFSGTVKDNIARLGAAEPEAVIAAAKLAGLHETIMRLPQGYDSDTRQCAAGRAQSWSAAMSAESRRSCAARQ